MLVPVVPRSNPTYRPDAGRVGARPVSETRGYAIRRNINVALNSSLLLLLILSFATGWIASLLGLTEFGLHKYSSIAVFVVACAHLVMHRRTFVAQIRRRFHSAAQPAAEPRLRILRWESAASDGTRNSGDCA